MTTISNWRAVKLASAFISIIGVVIGCSDTIAPASRSFGLIRVVTTTSGGDPDDDGYKIIIDHARNVIVGVDRVAFFDSMSVGSHDVAVEGVANNCDPVKSRSVDVVAGDTVSVSFDVKCEATGVTITTQTTGPDYGPFTIALGSRTGSIASNGTLALTRLTPGTQTVSIVNLPSFCQVVGGNSIVVNVTNRKVARVALTVTCRASDKVLAFVLDDFRGGFVVGSKADGTEGDTLVKGRTPAWSPSGKKIMYSNAECLGYGYYGEVVKCFGGLFLLNPESRVSTAVQNGQNGQDPAWSPDGKAIVFSKIQSSYADPARLYIMKIDGAWVPVELKVPTAIDLKHPAWSPDGKQIAFQCRMPGSDGFSHNQICVINVDGTGFSQLTTEESYHYSLRPAWSPDGKQIAFATSRFTKVGDPNPTSIAVMSPDGSNVTRIATGDSPAWSPDGSRLLFNTIDGLFISNPDGSAQVRITSGRHRYAAWRPPVDSTGAGDWDY